MPRIIVLAEFQRDHPCRVVHQERVVVAHFESDHHAGQLVERLGWAIVDADELEQADRDSLSSRSWPPHRRSRCDKERGRGEAA